MKNKITLTVAAITFGSFFIFNNTISVANSGGSIGGYSSSAGDGGQSCGQGGCHGGGHTVSTSPLVSTDIPVTGYVPGNTYNVTVTGPSGGYGKFGFELAAEDASNNTAGTLIPTSREQLRGNNQITHVSSSTAPVSGTFNWQFQWTAPTAGTADVTFYTTVLYANGNGGNSGDSAVISNITFTEDATVSIEEKEKITVSAYPNPTTDMLHIQSKEGKPLEYELIDSKGATVISGTIAKNIESLSVSDLNKGAYMLKITDNSNVINKVIIKK